MRRQRMKLKSRLISFQHLFHCRQTRFASLWQILSSHALERCIIFASSHTLKSITSSLWQWQVSSTVTCSFFLMIQSAMSTQNYCCWHCFPQCVNAVVGWLKEQELFVNNPTFGPRHNYRKVATVVAAVSSSMIRCRTSIYRCRSANRTLCYKRQHWRRG